jgi:hypothetical protein
VRGTSDMTVRKVQDYLWAIVINSLYPPYTQERKGE